MHRWTFDAIGTGWEIDTPEPLAEDVTADVLECVEHFDRTWSRFRDDSVVTAISRSAGEWVLPGEADALLSLFDGLNEVTGGAVNPLVGRALSDLGYDASYSLESTAALTVVPPWESVHWHPPVLTTTEPVLLDVGAAGKGLLVDLVAAVLRPRVDSFTVDASGDMYHRGADAIRVAMEHPADPSRAIGVVDLTPDRALAASATNRRAWGDGLHHVLDARTGRPTGDVVATWVVAASCLAADGLATAHFLAEPDVLMARFQHEFVRMHADGRIVWSPGFPGEVFA